MESTPLNEVDSSAKPATKSGPKLRPKKLLHILLVLLIAAAPAVGAWFYQQQNIDKLKAEITGLTDQVKTLEAIEDSEGNTDETVEWTKYDAGLYNLRYKPGWLVKTCSRDDPNQTVYLAPDSESQVICNSEKGAQMSFAVYDRDARTNEDQIDDYATAISISAITLNDTAGKRISYTHIGNEFVQAGTKDVSYEFYTDGKTYTAYYSESPDYTDVLADFELMITNTWQFSSM